MSESTAIPAPVSASHLERIKQDAMRGMGASSGDTLRLVGELGRFIRDPLTIESNWVNAMFNIIEDQGASYAQLEAENRALTAQVAALQSDANSWQSGYDEGRRMGTKTALSERDSFRRLADFWRSPKEAPPEGATLIVLRDAGTVGNGAHPGHRCGRWLELTKAWPTMFVCDALSTGQVVGWVSVEEFKGLKALIQNSERYQVLRQADIDTIHNGGLFAGLTPENIVINGQDLDGRTDAVIAARTVQADE